MTVLEHDYETPLRNYGCKLSNMENKIQETELKVKIANLHF